LNRLSSHRDSVLTATSGTFLLTVNTPKYFNERIIFHEKAEDTENWTLLKAGALEQTKNIIR